MKTLVQTVVAIFLFFLVVSFPSKVGTLISDGVRAIFNISLTVGKNAPTTSGSEGSTVKTGGRSAKVVTERTNR